jgi:hypothetical protein
VQVEKDAVVQELQQAQVGLLSELLVEQGLETPSGDSAADSIVQLRLPDPKRNSSLTHPVDFEPASAPVVAPVLRSC